MSDERDAEPRPKPVHVLGQPLDVVSIAEIDLRIELLRAEIARLEAAREQKRAAQAAADAFFKT